MFWNSLFILVCTIQGDSIISLQNKFRLIMKQHKFFYVPLKNGITTDFLNYESFHELEYDVKGHWGSFKFIFF